MDMKNCRPICLLNVSYKIITKVLNNRLASCIDKVISNYQFGFCNTPGVTITKT
jgi:hypothetical protein